MPSSNRERILQAVLLLSIVLVGAYFRFTGLTWGGYEYPHPDERFLIWVVADIAPVDDPGAYFDTQESTLNPANRGHAFYVYGDLPVIATRYIAEWTSDQVGWEQILKVGRGLSAGLDLLTVLLVYLIAQRLTNWKWAGLAGLFSAAAVLQIQQSHFFTVDSFATTFTTLAVYLAVVLATEVDGLTNRRVALLSVLFGATVGLSMACKLNTFPVALLLPAAFAVRWLRLPRASAEAREDPPGDLLELKRWKGLLILAGLAAAGGLAAVLVFRIAQPYAFSGPGFFNLSIDKGWLKSINDLRAQSAGDVDFPPALQWARRSHLFSLKNMVLWGLGAPLGLLAWAGFFLFAWTAGRSLLKKKWSALLESQPSGALLVWGWTAFYFTWQSLAWNPTMRYQLPIYPTLAVLAAWGTAQALRWAAGGGGKKSRRFWKAGVGVLGGLALILTLAWAFAFTRIYTRTESRLAASQWIFENVPGPLNLTIDGTPEGTFTQLVPLSEQAVVRVGQPYITAFDNPQPAALDAVLLPSTQVSAGTGMTLRARVVQASQPEALVAQGSILLPKGTFDRYELPLTSLAPLQPGERYALILEIPTGDAGGDANSSEMGYSALQLSGQLQLRLYARAQQAVLKASGFQMGSFQLDQPGTLRQVRLAEGGASPSSLAVITNNPQTGEQQSSLAARGENDLYLLENPLSFSAGTLTLAAVSSQDPSQVLEPTQEIRLEFLDQPSTLILPALTGLARADNPLWMQFSAKASGRVSQVTLGYAAQVDPGVGTVPVAVELSNQALAGSSLFSAQLNIEPAAEADPRGKAYTLTINPPVEVQEGQLYTLTLTPQGQGAVTVRGSAPANESSWDMGLPFRTGGYDPYGGIYRGDLNFEMYWDDNADKYQRFTGILDNADWVFMSSNRQWGTTTRVPERHPLTTEFYRALLGCPADKEVIWCYNVAEPGMFKGELGFELVKTFTSYPNLGPLQINTQFAEEAFTVYDHAKVMLFRKTAAYNSAEARAVLGKVDLNRVARFTPKKAAEYKNMLLPAVTWAAQQAGGTWASLFPPGGLQNRTPWLGLVLWYVFLWLLGVVVYPLLRLALRSLDDRAYPLARITGLLLLAYPAWLGGSLGVPVTRAALLVIFAALVVIGAGLAFLQRGSLKEEWRARRGYFLRVELIALALFTLSLLIRLGNPDLWHPIYGGEKPMDFSHFNAVLKSTLFPAYDPWFAGGSLNYYYFGYVLVGMPVKLLGITPSVAYNLILPALFSMVGLAAFSIGWNLAEGGRGRSNECTSEEETSEGETGEEFTSEELMSEELMGKHIPHFNASPHPSSTHNPSTHTSSTHPPSTRHSYFAGLFAILALLILGNLGTLRMLWEGPQKLMVSDEEMRAGSLFQRISWTAQGIGKLTSGEARGLPYSPADWYWKPSRAIQPEAGNEITEFPFFTFIYADLHAHLMALPLTLLGIAWALAALFSGGRPRGTGPSPEQNRLGTGPGWLSYGLMLLLGALVYGALRPSNTWDQYTYLALGCIALAVGQWKALIPSPSPGGGREQYTNPDASLGEGREQYTNPDASLGGGREQYTNPDVSLGEGREQYTNPDASLGGGREQYTNPDASLRGGRENDGSLGRWLWVLLPPLALAGLAVLLYRPFDWYFGQGYSELVVYAGAKTHIGSYLVHWGLFFFVIAAWLFSELVDWMAATPLSHVNRLRPYKRWITAVLLVMIILLAFLVFRGVAVVWIAGPLGLLAALLLLRPGQPLAKRAVLFMIGTALVLTLAVELVAVKGDINRMNTVFKFYYQAWSLLSLSAAAALGWLLRRNARSGAGWSLWLVGLGVLVCCAALYPVTAARGKIIDRMTPEAPRTLDGMDYMAFTRYGDGPTNETYREMDLNQDYYAIRWVQQNIQGTPVIVEAHTPEYRHWGTRFTIYTGLPAVVGWNWHERQQRALTPDTWVYERVNAVPAFYNTTNVEEARAFLEKYDVGLIVVGQLERIYYTPSGLAKFEELNGVLWDKVYAERDTVIYQVK